MALGKALGGAGPEGVWLDWCLGGCGLGMGVVMWWNLGLLGGAR